MRAIIKCITSLVCLVSIFSISAHAQKIVTRDISSGACMVTCNDVSFCRDYDYNRQTGTCTIFMNSNHRGFIRLKNSCPQVPVANWVIFLGDNVEKWAIKCPDPNLQRAPPPSADMMDGLQ